MTHHLDPLDELSPPILACATGRGRKCGNCRFFTPPSEARAELSANPVFARVMEHLSPARINLAATEDGPVFPADAQPKPVDGEEFKPVAAREVPKPIWDSWDAFGICRHPKHAQGRWFGDTCDDWGTTRAITTAVWTGYLALAVAVGSGLAWWLGYLR